MKRAVFMAAAMAAALGASSARAETFTSAEFLKWPRESQASYFRTSIGMSGVIASQIAQNIAPCIDEWYFKDAATQARREETIRELMRQYPDYHPQAVILALVQKQCGKLKAQ